MYDNSGPQTETETIRLDKLNLSQGVYYVKVTGNGMQGVQKLLKK
ncbi:MAG: T9SS type A sorting domain-containing protein [Paludibacter sp.]|nr:T9SS type A sorting domain-containing protein [Paludibacter sp.]